MLNSVLIKTQYISACLITAVDWLFLAANKCTLNENANENKIRL